MKASKSLAILVLTAILLSSCLAVQPAPTDTPTSLPPTEPAPTVEPIIPATPEDANGGYPPAVLAALRALAKQLNIPLSDIKVSGVEAVDWPDACLGVITPGEACAQVVTPGFKVLLVVGGAQYEFHTNAKGTAVRQAGKPGPHSIGEEVNPLIVWQGPDGNTLSVTLEMSYFGRVGDASLRAAPFVSPRHSQRLQQWVQLYQTFSAQTPAGKVTFNGFGRTSASAAEQRMLAEWSTLRFAEAQSGRSGAAWDSALSFSRAGGIAGFCDTLAVYRDGSVMVEEGCQSKRADFLLDAAQLAQLYDWLDTYQHTEYHHSDQAVADGMSVSLVLEGTGQKTAGEDVIRAMADFASLLTMQVK
jgi:chitodextrinase